MRRARRHRTGGSSTGIAAGRCGGGRGAPLQPRIRSETVLDVLERLRKRPRRAKVVVVALHLVRGLSFGREVRPFACNGVSLLVRCLDALEPGLQLLQIIPAGRMSLVCRQQERCREDWNLRDRFSHADANAREPSAAGIPREGCRTFKVLALISLTIVANRRRANAHEASARERQVGELTTESTCCEGATVARARPLALTV
jgi:hypothetical protein